MGLFDFLGGFKTSGTDAGNAFAMNQADLSAAQGALGNLLRYQGSDAAIDPLKSSQIATQQVANNDILGQLYGKGGTLDRTNQQEQDLSNRGFSLKPEDYEAYGQGSDQIAREFGASSGNLAQSLSDRGLSNSGVAGQAFSGLGGNKTEMLGQLQRQIANDRMNMNLQRLGQTRQFLGGLGQQAGNEIQNQYGRQLSSEQQNFNETAAKNAAAQRRLAAYQGQNNENLGQRQQTQQQQGWASALQGIGNFGAQGALSGAFGGFGGNSGGNNYGGNSGMPSSDSFGANGTGNRYSLLGK